MRLFQIRENQQKGHHSNPAPSTPSLSFSLTPPAPTGSVDVRRFEPNRLLLPPDLLKPLSGFSTIRNSQQDLELELLALLEGEPVPLRVVAGGGEDLELFPLALFAGFWCHCAESAVIVLMLMMVMLIVVGESLAGFDHVPEEVVVGDLAEAVEVVDQGELEAFA